MASSGQHYQIPGSNGNRGAPVHSGFVEIKSKFDAEFRRFTLNRDKYRTFESFRELLEVLHLLKGSPSDNIPPTPFHISYVDPKDNDLLPINNTDNYLRALQTAKPSLRLVVQRHGELQETYYTGRRVPSGAGTSLLTSMLGTSTPGGKSNKPLISISQPSEFRQVAAIIDPDQVPDTCRRVRLLKHGSDKPLGFYIRDGTSVRVTPTGIEKVPGIFISRLLAGGLAESTGLLAVNDEVLEVNGIEVVGKSLDQVTDMMVANSSNLIVTVEPANQSSLHPTKGTFCRNSNMSCGNIRIGKTIRKRIGQLWQGSSTSNANSDTFANHQIEHDEQEEDEIRDLTNVNQGLDGMDGGGALARGSMASGNNLATSSDRRQVLHL